MTAHKLFGTRDLYEILQLDRDAQINDGKQKALRSIHKAKNKIAVPFLFFS